MLNSPPPAVIPQTQILELITAADPATLLNTDRLTLSHEDPLGLKKVPPSETLESLEDRVVERLCRVIRDGEAPRLLLYGPGLSRTDPLYALRFLAKLAVKTGRTGELTVYDLQTNPLIGRYYAALPWNGHVVRLSLGGEGNFAKLKGANAHMILAIHPGIGAKALFPSFAENLVRGGIVVTQSSVPDEFTEEGDYSLYLNLIERSCLGPLAFLQPPLRSRVFRSFFAERSDDVHMMVLEKSKA